MGIIGIDFYYRNPFITKLYVCMDCDSSLLNYGNNIRYRILSLLIMPFKSNGSLTTNFQEITDSYQWDDEISWNDYMNRDDARIITNPDTSLVGLETILDNSMVDTFEDTIYADNNQTIDDVYSFPNANYDGFFNRLLTYYQGHDNIFDGYYFLEVGSTADDYAVMATTNPPHTSITQGDSFECTIIVPDTGIATAPQAGIIFGYNDTTEFYTAEIEPNGDDFLMRQKEGTVTMSTIANGSTTIDYDTPYILSIEWIGGDIYFDLLDINRNTIDSISTGGPFKDPYENYTGHGFIVTSGRESRLSSSLAYYDNYLLDGAI